MPHSPYLETAKQQLDEAQYYLNQIPSDLSPSLLSGLEHLANAVSYLTRALKDVEDTANAAYQTVSRLLPP